MVTLVALAGAGCGESRPMAAKLASIVPTEHALHVGVLAPITVQFTGPLRPESVTTETVRLLPPDATFAMAATVSYDELLHRITLQPAAPLAYGTKYRLHTSGLQDAGGGELPPLAAYEFTTLFNAVREVQGQEIALDSVGRYYRRQTFDPGPDGVQGTADDVVSECAQLAYDDRGVTTTYLYAAGPDGRCFTVDDALRSYSVDDRSAFGRWRTWRVDYPGDDQIWGTEDDYCSMLSEYEMDERGRVRRMIRSDPGEDKLAFTSDDVPRQHDDTEWHGLAGRMLSYTDRGPDRTWLTEDDVPSAAESETVDEAGRCLTLTRFEGPGPDQIWRTFDDDVLTFERWSYDARGLLERIARYSNPGPDLTWDTADDVLYWDERYTYDDQGARLTQNDRWVGPDMVPNTDDDLVFPEQLYEPSL